MSVYWIVKNVSKYRGKPRCHGISDDKDDIRICNAGRQ